MAGCLKFCGMIAVSLFLLHCQNKAPDHSVDELAANFRAWDGKQISLSGYAVITGQFEAPAHIWASKEKAARREFAPSVTIITLSEKYPRKEWRSPYKGKVRVWGTFRFADYDPLNKLHLDEITKAEWLE